MPRKDKKPSRLDGLKEKLKENKLQAVLVFAGSLCLVALVVTLIIPVAHRSSISVEFEDVVDALADDRVNNSRLKISYTLI